MNSRGSLKKLIIDITIPVMIFSFVIGALFFSQRGYQFGSNFQESDFLDEDAWYAVRNEKAGSVSSTAPRCLLVLR